MNYIIEVNIGIVFLYSMYLLLLGNETDFRKQRVFLIAGVLCSLLFPLIQMPVSYRVSEELTTIVLPEVLVTPSSAGGSFDYVVLIYLLIAIVIAIPLFIHAIKLYRSIKEFNVEYNNGYYVIESNDNLPSWSFFKFIYIGRSTELTNADKELVIKHEMLHGQLYHSADMLFVTLLCIVFWFNPVVWFYRRTLAKVHEFEVDTIIAEQDGAVDYSVLLAKTALSGNGILLTHHFNQSFILKRINMINMIKNRISSWKLVVLGMTVAAYFGVVSCTDTVNQNETANEKTKELEPWKGEVLKTADNVASPVGGMTELMDEIGSALQYPESAKNKGLEGKVFVEFIVRPDGQLSDFKVLKGFDPECDKAAVDAISTLKKWNPGSNQGKTVAMSFVLPIQFKLD